MAKADGLIQTASHAQDKGQFQQAFHIYLRAFRVYRACSDVFGQLQCAQKAGDMARQIEDFPTAIKWYRVTESLLPGWRVDTYRKDQFRTDSSCGQAMAFRGQGKFSKAIRLFQKVYLTYKKIHDKSGQAYTLWALGTTCRFKGDLKKAEKALRESISIYLELEDPSGLAYAQAGLGGTLRMKGLARDSQLLYKSANKFFSRTGDLFGQAYTLCGQGNALRMQGKLADGKKFMNKAIKIYVQLNQKGPRGFVLWSRAQVHILSGQFLAASSDLKMASRLFRQVQDERGLVYCELGWGEFFRRKKNQRFKIHFNRALKMTKNLDLKLERAHALSRLSKSKDKTLYYRPLGIDPRRFCAYISLP